MTDRCLMCHHNEELLLRQQARNEHVYRLYVTYYQQCVAQAKGLRRLHKLITRLKSAAQASPSVASADSPKGAAEPAAVDPTTSFHNPE